MSIGLQRRFMYSIICFLKTSIILNMKIVPNDIFIFGGERVKQECDVICTENPSILEIIQDGIYF